jgi:hypothetical protein
MAVETLWEISLLGPPLATAKTTGKVLPALAKPGIGKRIESRFRAHASLHMPVKNDAGDSVTHRQNRAEVYTRTSVSNLRFKSTKEVSNGH